MHCRIDAERETGMKEFIPPPVDTYHWRESMGEDACWRAHPGVPLVDMMLDEDRHAS
jgi:hypothetical protein